MSMTIDIVDVAQNICLPKYQGQPVKGVDEKLWGWQEQVDSGETDHLNIETGHTKKENKSHQERSQEKTLIKSFLEKS